MLKWIFALAALCAFPAYAADIGERHTLTHNSLERAYHLFVPEAKYDQSPLVVVLHGGAGSPQQVAKSTGFSELAAKEGFIVAYPEGSGHVPTWNAGKCCGYAAREDVDDVGFIEAMVKDIRQRHEIDTTRIYATGMSNGGMMTYRLACELSGLFAAVAPVAGALNTFDCKPNGRLSMAIVHALDDRNVRYEGGLPAEGLRAYIGRGQHPDASVADAMTFWLDQNLCRDFPSHEKMIGYKKVTYFCAEGREMAVFIVDNGGHTWPKDKPDATDEIWRFFRKHPPRELF